MTKKKKPTTDELLDALAAVRFRQADGTPGCTPTPSRAAIRAGAVRPRTDARVLAVARTLGVSPAHAANVARWIQSAAAEAGVDVATVVDAVAHLPVPAPPSSGPVAGLVVGGAG